MTKTKVLMRPGKFNIFWVRKGNDALEAPHHTRDEGDQHLAVTRREMLRQRLPTP
jgi:predicted NUDIX family NTP pyrophosphohydrolase